MTFPSTIGGLHDPEIRDVTIVAQIDDCVACGIAFSPDYDALMFADHIGDGTEVVVPWSQVCMPTYLVGRTSAGDYFCYRILFDVDPQTFEVRAWSGIASKGAGWPDGT